MSEFIQALKTARTMYPRSMLALAATMYAIFTAIGPSKEQFMDVTTQVLPKLMVFPFYYKMVVAAVFALDAIGLWWRIFDSKPRVVWATIFNILTAGLWLMVTVISIWLYGEFWTDNVGEITLTLTALYTLTRTDYTPADRGSA